MKIRVMRDDGDGAGSGCGEQNGNRATVLPSVS